MLSALAVFGAIILLVGFIVLVHYETRSGVRVCEQFRARLDAQMIRIEFILAHVDLGAFVQSETRAFIHRVGHDSVHIALGLVRAVERLLTRMVRQLRKRNVSEEVPRESAREFVRTLADFKGTLEAKHHEIQNRSDNQ